MPKYRFNNWEGFEEPVKHILSLRMKYLKLTLKGAKKCPFTMLAGLTKHLHYVNDVRMDFQDILMIGDFLPPQTMLAGTDCTGQFFQDDSRSDWYLRTADREGVYELQIGYGQEVVYLMGKPGLG